MNPPSRDCPPDPSGLEGRDTAATQTIPVVREALTVSRVPEATGRALRVRIETVEERERLPVTDVVETLTVERVPIGRVVAERSAPREENGVLIVPVFETVPVVEMRLVLKEELRLVRERREIVREEEVTVRRDRPIVERRDSDQEEWRQDPTA